jgi:Caspase domain
MKTTLLIFFIVLTTYVKGQSLYEIQFTGPDKSKYTCFLVYYNENNAYMRIRYHNQDGALRVVQVKYTGESGKYVNGESYFSLTGETPAFITEKSDKESYNPDYFVWMGNNTIPYTTDASPDANGKRTVFPVDSYIKLDPKQLKSDYLRAFYRETDRDYLSLIKMSDDNQVNKRPVSDKDITLHLIVLANTQIFDIGKGCEVDMNHLDYEFDDIASTLKISYDKHLISGSSFTKQNLLTELDNLNIGSNDIVMFVYRGHGFRWSDQGSEYPTLALTRSQSIPVSTDNSVLLDDVYNSIIKKGARLNLVMADCCNSDIGVNQWSNDNYLYMQSNASAQYDRLYDLFINRKGNLLFAASKKGEVSWTNSVYGGFFTTSFLQALVEEISYMKTSESSWINLVTNTRTIALNKSTNCSNCSVQHAISYNQITKR